MLGQLLFLGLKGPQLSASERELLREIQPGGFILFTRNIESAAQTRQLTDSLRALSEEEPFIAIDNEGGRVWRTQSLGATPPSAQEMAQYATAAQQEQLADLTAEHLQLLGITMNFAPVLDLDHHREEGLLNSLRGRCYGTNANEVIEKAGRMNRRMRRNQLITCAKHFPSCGLAQHDPHHDLPTVEQSLTDLLKADLIPYTALLPELPAVMTAHVIFPELDAQHPATLSPRIIQGLLRDQLNYQGLSITDDLDMGAIVKHYGRGSDVRRAIEAGNDMALICHQTHTAPLAYRALEDLNPYRVEESLKRIKKQKKTLPILPAFCPDRWERNVRSIHQLRERVLAGRPSLDGPSQSPVEDF